MVSVEGPGGGGARGAAGATGSTGGGGGGREVTGSKGGGTGCRRGGGESGADAVEGREAVAGFGGAAGSRIRLMTLSES